MSIRPMRFRIEDAEQWDVNSAPHVRTPMSASRITWTVIASALPCLAAGTVIFGLRSGLVVAVAIGAAAVVSAALGAISRRRGAMDLPQAMLIGLLLGLTLPPNVDWTVPVAGSAIAILVGKGILGGQGNYLWPPALIGRVGLQLLVPEAMLPQVWPILGRDELVFGRLSSLFSPGLYFGWRETPLPAEGDAWLLQRVDRLLAGLRESVVAEGGAGEIGVGWWLWRAIRDVLPPWGDTVLGLTPGGIGETSAVCILVGGLYLMHRGCVRWQLPLCVVAGAAATAAVWPLTVGGERLWWPGLAMYAGEPVGPLYVLFHLTSGELLFAAFFMATEMVCTPLRARGQVVFGLGIGVLTIVLRMYGVIPGAGYWAVLLMNVSVPAIDRVMRRRVMGT